MASPVTASQLLQEVFHTDLKDSVQKPKQGKETIVREGGKVKTLSTKKILKGNYAEFQKLEKYQNRAITSIMNAASIIAGQRPVEGGDEKLTKKIIARFKKFKESAEIDAKRFAEELYVYASQLQKEHCIRRWFLDKQTGFHDRQALTVIAKELSKQGTHLPGWATMVQENFESLKGVNSTIQDLHRYGQNNRYHLFIEEGKEFPLPNYSGEQISVYLDRLLQTFMVNLNMMGEGAEPILSDHAEKIRSQLQVYIREEISKADKLSSDPTKKERAAEMIPQKEVDDASQDQVRDALKRLIEDLSQGKLSKNNEEQLLEKKLGFLLFGMNQNWVVGPGIQFGRIAKECGAPERFRETLMSAAVKIDGGTEINLYIDPEGSLKVEAIGTHTNYDHVKEGAPQDYVTEIATTIEFQPDRLHDVTFSLLIKIPERDTKMRNDTPTPEITKPETKALVDVLNAIGFQPKVFSFVPETPRESPVEG